MKRTPPIQSRRQILKLAGAGALMVPVGLAMPRISRAASRPLVTHGLQSGDIGANHGVIWARADRPARAVFEVATNEGFRDARTLPSRYMKPTDFPSTVIRSDAKQEPRPSASGLISEGARANCFFICGEWRAASMEVGHVAGQVHGVVGRWRGKRGGGVGVVFWR